MTDQSNVFNNQENTQATPETVQPQSGDIFSDQLKNIKAEDGRQKYDTVEKALDALAHSQSFIPELQGKVTTQEEEITKLREELAKRDGVQDVVDKLAQHQQSQEEVTAPETQIGEADIARLVEATLEKRTQQQVAVDNANKVNKTLVEAFGDKAISVVQAKAKELNTTPEALGKLSEQSPDMVLALFQQKSTSPSLTSGSHNLGFNAPKEEPVGRPEKSLLSGATSADQRDYMRKIKEEVYKKFNVTQ